MVLYVTNSYVPKSNFEYQYVLNELVEGNVYGGDPVIMSTMENMEGEQFSIIGTTDDNPYLQLEDMDGNDISLGDGYYITSTFGCKL